MLTFVLGLVLVSGNANIASTTQAGESFERWYRQAVTRSLDVPPEVAGRARGYRYVFVAGFRNESIRGYFTQNVAELRRQGVPSDQIDVIRPDSNRSEDENAVQIQGELIRIANRGSERLVIVGHSRGACDVLTFALGHPDFVAERVEAMFLLQGPFGGSEAAAHLVGSGVAMNRRMPLVARFVASLAERVFRSKASPGMRDTLRSWLPEVARSRWVDRVAHDPDAARKISPKTFYVTSVSRPARLNLVRRAIARYLATYHGASDGFVLENAQSVPGVGTVLATVEAGHADLVSSTWGRPNRRLRVAVTDAIVMTVGRAPEPAWITVARPD